MNNHRHGVISPGSKVISQRPTLDRIQGEHPDLYIAHDAEGNKYILDDPLSHLNYLIAFMDQVINTDKLPYTITKRNNRPHAKRDSELATLLKRVVNAWSLMFDGDLAYSPDLALFFHCYRKHPIQIWGTNNESQEYVDAANDFITTMREEGKRIHIKRKIRDWRRNATENQKRLREYLSHLFARYARLMVIRLDLHYHKAACRDTEHAQLLGKDVRDRRSEQRKKFMRGETPSLVSDEKVLVSLDEVKNDWKRFHDNMRGKPSLFEHLVGHVVRFEFAKVAGFHIHVALFFDGSHVQNDKHYANEIGEYWIKITEGRGYFFDCNRKREQYKFPALGMVDYHDTQKRRNLLSALNYLAKADQIVRIKTSLKAKLFTTGQVDSTPKVPGRPRRKDDLHRTRSEERGM